MKMFILAALLGLSVTARASVVAIIDSGTDMLHKDIAPYAWTNPLERPGNDRDEDQNGYPDDINGWNFAESNNQVIDYSYLGLLSDDIRRFFAIQTGVFYGTATEEDLAWMKEIVNDEAFIKKLSTYGNFMHGTHVSGIAIKNNQDAQVLAVKLIPTEVKLPEFKSFAKEDKNLAITLLKAGLGLLAKEQMKLLTEIAAYVDGHKADIANGSFGTGYPQAKMIVEVLAKAVIKDITEEQIEDVTKHFLGAMISEGSKMVNAAPNTLFVFAAGNDGLNNDIYPSSPTNIQADNVLSVAATLEDKHLASFSNYGAAMVDVAAPGVGITSAVPGNHYLQVSGTSQAAPYVANVAGKVKDSNEKLRAYQIRALIMQTVDKREYLDGKVKTGGIVNSERAVRAAELSKSMNLNAAIALSHQEVKDNGPDKVLGPTSVAQKGFVLPLPSNFVITH
jgi:subtilisin family serine protease